MYDSAQPDNLDEIRIRMRISNLEARLEMLEIEIAALDREIASPLTPSKRMAEATERRDAGRVIASGINAELEELRRSHPRRARR